MNAGLVTGRAAAAGIPEASFQTSPLMQPPLMPSSGPDYQPVVTLNGWTLPWRQNGDWKEFHLVAEPVVREISPCMKAHLWGYNGQSPGPTIEAVEGDKVRIFVTNKLPEHNTPKMTVREDGDVTVQNSKSSYQLIGAAGDLSWGFTARASVAKDVPVWPLFADINWPLPLVVAVVPLG